MQPVPASMAILVAGALYVCQCPSLRRPEWTRPAAEQNENNVKMVEYFAEMSHLNVVFRERDPESLTDSDKTGSLCISAE